MIELSSDEKKRLAGGPHLSSFQRSKLDRESKKNWDLFYKRNGDRFFKNRYWTRHEFQELFVRRDDVNKLGKDTPRLLLEVGCGCGDFVFPILESHHEKESTQANLFIYCCDISDRAIEILKANPIYKLNHPHRIKAFACDITQEVEQIQSNIEENEQIDIISLIFILSALDPTKMKKAVENLHTVLRPGGLVIFRDYAIYDKAMLRFSESSKICDQFYVRQDGTRAYFFSKEQLVELFESCRFQCQSIDYVRRETVNKATKDTLSRIFLQARFIK